MKRLVSRYIHQTKKKLRQGGVNEDDILEIKQDISSLRSVNEDDILEIKQSPVSVQMDGRSTNLITIMSKSVMFFLHCLNYVRNILIVYYQV